MALFIKELHDLIDFYAGKNIATKHSPSKKDEVIYEVLVELFSDLYERYPRTTKIDRLLDPFKKTKVITITSGIGTLPDGYAYERSCFVSDTNIEVDYISDHQWGNSVNDPVMDHTEKNPIYTIDTVSTIEGRRVLVYPKSVGKVDLKYFKYPTKPKYGFTQSGTRYIYNEAESTDVEFDISMKRKIIDETLSRYGINIRDQELFNYAEIQKQQDVK